VVLDDQHLYRGSRDHLQCDHQRNSANSLAAHLPNPTTLHCASSRVNVRSLVCEAQ
jgi:hypothetical protein